jgi:YesN/AraC family two-component response regulator
LYIPKNKESIVDIQKDKQKAHLNESGNIDFLVADEEDQNSDLQKYQILIVEDNPELRQYLVKNLSLNFQVEDARNGKEGLEKSFQFIPDLIVTDVMMPEMDGFELLKAIKADERTSHIPVLILTAKNDGEDHLTGLETGASDYLMKPFEIRLLTMKIRNMLEMQKKMRERYSTQVFISPSDLPISNIDETFIRRAIDVVEKNMKDEDFNVEKFSGQLNMSHIQLYRKLNAIANLSPSDFIRTIRLKRAAQLITQGNLNINEVCYETGFNNPSYFTKCFKKEFGVLPKDYKSKI